MKITLLVSIIIFGSSLLAQEITVRFTNYPPFAYSKDNKNDGFALKTAREILKKSGIQFREGMTTVSEYGKISESENAIIAAVQRTKTREKELQWIGKIYEDRICFATLKDKPEIKTFDDAMKVGKVGVSKGGSVEKMLLEKNFKNLDYSTNHPGNARKLYSGKIDAWPMGEAVVYSTIKYEGLDPKLIKCDGDFQRSEFWMAASNKMKPEQLKKLQASFAELEKSGAIKKFVDEYLK